MVPLPGTAGASWASYRAEFVALLRSTSFRTFVAFWLFGLVNNVLYVIILSAAVDLVGSRVPVGLVLLADVLPSFIVKLVAPYWIHLVPYGLRMLAFVLMSIFSMLLIATSPDATNAGTVALKLLGVAIASISSGGGELSFLGLTHFYPSISLAAWGSGTGAAGLVGAGAYVIATTTLGMTSKMAMIAFSFLPLLMLISYFLILPPKSESLYRKVSIDRSTSPTLQGSPSPRQRSASPESRTPRGLHDPDGQGERNEQESLLSQRISGLQSQHLAMFKSFEANLKRVRKLIVPYMLPLLLVYIAEYTINQGVAPTLLFPLRETPFKHYRDFYPTYNAIYQVGVFVSRSSIAFLRIHHLYLPSLFQIINLFLLTSHSLFGILGNIWVVFAVIFWEGLLGGFVYVNTFAEITDNVPAEDREFSLSATTVSDSGGICIAALLSMAFETYLCDWQVARGFNHCRVHD